MQEPHQVAQKLTSNVLWVGFVRNFLQVVSRSQLEPDGLGFDFPQGLQSLDSLLAPLRRAAEDAGVRHGYFAIGQQRLDGVARFVRLHHFFAIAVIHAAFVAQAAIAIEHENVRRRLRAVSARHRLRFAVIKVRIGEMLVLGPDLHLLQAVAHVGGIEFVNA